MAEALNQIRSRQASVMCLISIEPRVGVNHCSPCTCRVADSGHDEAGVGPRGA